VHSTCGYDVHPHDRAERAQHQPKTESRDRSVEGIATPLCRALSAPTARGGVDGPQVLRTRGYVIFGTFSAANTILSGSFGVTGSMFFCWLQK